MIEHSTEVVALFKAMHDAQGELSGVKRDSTNPHFRNRYASLESVIEAAKGPLQKNGLAFTQAPGAMINGAVEITTMLMHTSGEWLRSTLHVPLSKTDPQGVGSAITYGCRYALMATLGLPPVDDDAEAAVHRPPPVQATKSRPQDAPPPTAPVEQEGYVKLCTEVIRAEKSEAKIKSWWASEQANRKKHNLVPNQGPGLELVMAYHDKVDELKNSNPSNLLRAG